MITIKCDGTAKKLSGRWVGAYALIIRKDGWKYDRKNGFLGNTQNGGQEMEVQAILKALKYAQDHDFDEKVIVKTDCYSAYNKVNNHPALENVAEDIEIWRVPRSKVVEADLYCDEVWNDLLHQEPRLSMEDFYETMKSKSD